MSGPSNIFHPGAIGEREVPLNIQKNAVNGTYNDDGLMTSTVLLVDGTFTLRAGDTFPSGKWTFYYGMTELGLTWVATYRLNGIDGGPGQDLSSYAKKDSPDLTGKPTTSDLVDPTDLTSKQIVNYNSLVTYRNSGEIGKGPYLLYRGDETKVREFATLQAAINATSGSTPNRIVMCKSTSESVSIVGSTTISIFGSGLYLGGLAVSGTAVVMAMVNSTGIVSNIDSSILYWSGDVTWKENSSPANEALYAAGNGTLYAKGNVTVSGNNTVGGVAAGSPGSTVYYDGIIRCTNGGRGMRNNQGYLSQRGLVITNGIGIAGRTGTTEIYGVIDTRTASPTAVDGNGISVSTPMRWSPLTTADTNIIVHESAEFYAPAPLPAFLNDNGAAGLLAITANGLLKTNGPLGSSLRVTTQLTINAISDVTFAQATGPVVYDAGLGKWARLGSNNGQNTSTPL